MGTIDHRRLRISTLSPVHIGCDEIFDPSQFVIADGLLHVLEPSSLGAALDEKERQTLLRLTSETDPIGPIQQFFKARRARLTPLATHWVDVAGDIARDYEEKAGQAQAKGGEGRPIYNMFPIARTAFTPVDGLPYLPGSSLKGSLRTAWLNRLNKGAAPREEEKRDAGKLQQRLLGYKPGKFEDDPFRLVGVADALPNSDASAPPTRIVYAISKKKRESERGSPELKVYLETLRETLAEAFVGELRLSGSIGWNALCDACNAFYRPQLQAELDHSHFGPLLMPKWRQTLSRLLGGEMGELIKAQQGFLLRVGRHCGAESVTLDGVRSIKILGARGQPPSYRAQTTEKRFASPSKRGDEHLLPFGWLWIESCADTHGHLAIAVADTLREMGRPIREAHAARIAEAEARREAHEQAVREALRRRTEEEAQARREAEEAADRAAVLAAMTENQRRIEAFVESCRNRAEQLRGGRDRQNTTLHNRARELVKAAQEGADWTDEEKRALADAIEAWLPKLIEKMDAKETRKQLRLAALRDRN